MSNLKYFLQYSIFRDIWTVSIPSLVFYATSKLFNHPFSEDVAIGTSAVLLIAVILKKYYKRHERFAVEYIEGSTVKYNGRELAAKDKLLTLLVMGAIAYTLLFTFGVWLPIRYIFETTLLHNLSLLTLLILSVIVMNSELNDYLNKSVDF